MRRLLYSIFCVALGLLLEGCSLLGVTHTRRIDSLLIDTINLSADSLVRNYLASEGIKVYKGNDVVLLKNGHSKFEDLFEHIRQASHYIHLEYFNLRNDSITKALIHELHLRRQEGVEVRILFDAFGNMSNDSPLKRKHLDSIRRLGLEIYKFDPIVFPWINHVATRDHRKIVDIDGRWAYLGGMNVADYYIHGTKKVGAWRDMHCRISGPAVQDVSRIFERVWRRETKQKLDSARYAIHDTMSRAGGVDVAIVDRSPYRQPDAIKNTYALAIHGAEREINIINPYFVPTSAINRALRRALKKGIAVNIMVPAVSDIPFTPEAMLHKLRKLTKRGARVYLYKGGFQHAKVMTVDGILSTIGSANLNSRSLRYDYETNAFIFDHNITMELDSLYKKDIERCIPLDDTYWKKRSLWKRFVGWFANLFTPFL